MLNELGMLACLGDVVLESLYHPPPPARSDTKHSSLLARVHQLQPPRRIARTYIVMACAVIRLRCYGLRGYGLRSHGGM